MVFEKRRKTLREEIGDELLARTKSVFGSKKVAGKLFAQIIGCKQNTAIEYIRAYSLGYLSKNITIRFGGISSEDYSERLALFYKLLGVSKDDPIIDLTKKVNPDFKYMSIKNLEEKCHITVKFTQEHLSLNKEQLKHLEKLACLYARKNANG